MDEEFLLLNPGPVPVAPEVREAMDQPMVSHRSAAFEDIYERVQEGLEYVFEHSTPEEGHTSDGGRALPLNGTATMGMEAAVANLVDGDSEVVSLVNGKFGRRFARIADRHADCTRVEVEWGGSLSMAAIEEAIGPETDLVTMVHNETSTGLLNPVPEVGELTGEYDAHFVVDGVTSIGGDEFRLDDWHVDVAVTDAQKCLAAPPGTSALYVTESVEDELDGEDAPFYEDLEWHVRKAESNQTPFTSAVPLFRAMAVAVESIRQEGMGARIERHRRQARAFREGFSAMGLELFPELEGPSEYSNTVTAVELPAEIRGEPDPLMAALDERNVSVSGGQAHLGGEIFRVSNMGGFTPREIERGVRAVGESLRQVGVEADVEAGVAAATDHLG